MPTFGAELIVAQIAMEKVKVLRTKLRWYGTSIDGPTYMFMIMKLLSNLHKKQKAH